MSIEDQMIALERTAERLNLVSDQLNSVVDSINDSLKRLNIGLPAWYIIDEKLKVGYAKVKHKWGIAIEANNEQWHFRDAPRKLRLEVVDYFPNILDVLSNEAYKLTENIKEKNYKMKQIIEGINDANK